MRTQAAVLYQAGTDWKVEEIELDPPGAGEVLVRVAAAGLCHSEEHHRVGDIPFAGPMIGGHEGAGYVEAVGPGVSLAQPGDYIVFSSIPNCGRCPSCVRGRQNLCDVAAGIMTGRQISDGGSRHRNLAGADLTITCLVGCYARHTVVNEASVIVVDPSFRPEAACLTGCGVATGWGSSVYAGGVRPGDAVAVLALAAKRGRIVVTNIYPMTDTRPRLALSGLAQWEKQIVGCIFGSVNSRADVPMLLDLYKHGQLDLDAMVTRTYPLEGINQGYQDMHDGKNIRGVLVM